MANTLARFKKYTDKLDEVYQHASVTAVLETKEQAKAACIAETSPTNDGLDS